MNLSVRRSTVNGDELGNLTVKKYIHAYDRILHIVLSNTNPPPIHGFSLILQLVPPVGPSILVPSTLYT